MARETEGEIAERRKSYQDLADRTGKDKWWRGEQFRPGVPAAPEPVQPVEPGTFYKVLTQRDEFFGGKFDPTKLEDLINAYAKDGWRVVSIATADVSTFFGSFWSGRGARQEIVVFLEKTIG
jgi:hypothetical protein